MAGHRDGEAHRRGIPARIRRRLLRTGDIDGSWVAIVPRRGARRARVIAVGRLRGEVERLATERGFSPGGYSLFRVARQREAAEDEVDRAAEIRKLTDWARWGCP